MRKKLLLVAVPIALVVATAGFTFALRAFTASNATVVKPLNDAAITSHGKALVAEGRQVFRYATFGDQAFWGGALELHKAIEGSKLGGVGDGVSPKTALAVGLKIDVKKLPLAVRQALKAGMVNLDSPKTTLALIKLNAVLGVKGFFNAEGSLKSMGITCALCHSTVDGAFSAPGIPKGNIGNRLDGWANQDLNVGAIVLLTPHPGILADFLSTTSQTVTVADVQAALTAWGPGKFDAELFLDGKTTNPNTGESSATIIPPAFGLAGVNLHTWTAWGQVTYWNAFVANLEMHGQGTFFDPRLNNLTKFPVAVKNGLFDVRLEPGQADLISKKLAPLHAYQLAIPAPKPPKGSFDAASAARGDDLFSGKAKCSTCHVEDDNWTEPGWNAHTPAEIGIDAFQADRAPDGVYRTAPLGGLWTHQKRGFYHDGRFATLLDVVNHYDTTFSLGLSAQEKTDIVEYLKSLPD